MRCTFSETMLPPQVPQPRLEVIGIPLLNAPAFAFDCGWRTMIRDTGATSASALMWLWSNE